LHDSRYTAVSFPATVPGPEKDRFVMKILKTSVDRAGKWKFEFGVQNFHCFGAKSLTSCGFFYQNSTGHNR